MRYQLCCYDWNGSLADDFWLGYRCLRAIFRNLAPGIVIPRETQWRQENITADFWQFYYRNGIPESVTIEEMRTVWVNHYAELAAAGRLSLRGGAEQVLRFCSRQQAQNIIVSGSIDDVEGYLAKRNIDTLFHGVKLKVRQKRAVLAEIIEERDIAPVQAFYIDDTHDGLTQAKEVGMITFGLTGGFNCEEHVRAAKPDYVVHSFYDVLKILNA